MIKLIKVLKTRFYFVWHTETVYTIKPPFFPVHG